MPDTTGRIPPVAYSMTAEQYDRIFGPNEDSPEVARPGDWCTCDSPDCLECLVRATLRDEHRHLLATL